MAITTFKAARHHLGIDNLDWAALGSYVYAYYEPEHWSARIDHNGEGSSPTPFYVGIGTGKRAVAHIDEALKSSSGGSNKLGRIRTLLEKGEVPDIRILAYCLDEEASGLTRETVETVLISLYGRERGASGRDEFESRMGFASALTNKARSSTNVKAGSIASVGADLHKERQSLFDLPDMIQELQDLTHIEKWLTIGLRESFDPRANIDQLKAVTCSWWPPDNFPDDQFGVLGVSSDNHSRIGTLANPKPSAQVPVIRSAFIIRGGSRKYTDDGRVSFVSPATYDPGIWNAVVGKRLTYTTQQLQGQKLQPIDATKASCGDKNTLRVPGPDGWTRAIPPAVGVE